jgi:5-methylthioribose kinase
MLELTPENALEYLQQRGWAPPGNGRVEPMGWGVSNVVLRVRTAGHDLVVKQSRPQLRTRDAWFSDIRRVYREQEVMQLLRPLLPDLCVPEVLFADRDNFAFVMSHAPAEARVWKEMLLAGQVDRALARSTGQVLGLIHDRTAIDGSGVAAFADHQVFVQLRVEPFYERIRQRRPEVALAVAPLIERLLSEKIALCHGDYSPKNILVHDQGFTLVDYETAHFGDPTMDLGFFLSHLILKSLKHRPRRREYFDLTRAFWQGYEAQVQFRPLGELQKHAVGHFAVCALARIDGTSPVDYLLEEPKREAVRRLARQVLFDRPSAWEDVLGICEEEFSKEASG